MFYVGDFLEHSHQFGQVVEPRKSRPRAVPGALGRELYRDLGLAEGASTCVEMGEAVLLESFELEVPLHGVHFGHGV